MDMYLGKLWEMVRDRETLYATVHGVTKSWTRLGDWTTTTGYKKPNTLLSILLFRAILILLIYIILLHCNNIIILCILKTPNFVYVNSCIWVTFIYKWYHTLSNHSDPLQERTSCLVPRDAMNWCLWPSFKGDLNFWANSVVPSVTELNYGTRPTHFY